MKEKLHINIDAQLKRDLQQMADEDNRNLTNFLQTELAKVVEEWKEKKSDED